MALCSMLLPLPVIADSRPFPQDPAAWPAQAASHKPWTRWWWLGSAVDRPNLTRELEAFAKAGIGGVEICPIYGTKGEEKRYIDFLSPQWMDMLAHTTREAKRLGIGVDVTTGTGWPFGGPIVNHEMASAGLQSIHARAEGGKPLKMKMPRGDLQTLRAFGGNGKTIDLTGQVKKGQLEWSPPAGKWDVCGLVSRAEVQKVKRAAPGGVGNVLDPYSADSLGIYLGIFDRALKGFDAPLPRGWFHDSFEYYGASWSPDLFARFKKENGYDLRDRLPAFRGLGDKSDVVKVRADYRRTLGVMHLEWLHAWNAWAKKRGEITRNQAHGGPGNLLDAYAASDIPETEIFREVEPNQLPMMRLAASAAHANGTSLVSAEAFTWLQEHFKVTPALLKQAADFLFLSGVNHLFFHGIPYSPEDAEWPGWLFYASTHMGPNGGLWHDLPAFNGYLERCQSILQHGAPTSDVLVYFPYEDLIHDGRDKLPLFTLHNQHQWLHPTTFHRFAMACQNGGVTYDAASDAMLSHAKVVDGHIVLGSNRFKALVLPGVRNLPESSLKRIREIRAAGGKVLSYGEPMIEGFEKLDDDPVEGLRACGARVEEMVRDGLQFIRRTHADGFHYFIVNRGEKHLSKQIPLAVPFARAMVLDPWNPAGGRMPAQTGNTITVDLAPKQSIIVRTFTRTRPDAPPVSAAVADGPATELRGPWRLTFIEGGPELPPAMKLDGLKSWPELAHPACKEFSGTARYESSFQWKGAAGAPAWLDLGEVAHTARVFLNGKPAGISWAPPHRVDLTGMLAVGENHLTIEVTSLAANRIAGLDRRKVPWKRFHDINFASRDYKGFDASNWPPFPSGLLGPVTLQASSTR